MSDVDVFVIDDDFDPLADLSLDDGERDDAEADYLPPIPDADKSVVPPVVPLSAAERIENLLAGIPGQQFRLLHAVEFCTEPKTMDEAVADLDAAYPNTTSVYGSAQVVQLLERDGALERIVDEDAAHAAAGDAADALAEDEGFPTNTGNALVDEGYRMICGYLSQADGTVLTELAVDYVRAFIGSGNDGFSAAYPYESVYTSPKRLMMQDARDEVLVLYRAFGLDKQESWKEGEDHIALELEFEQILCERAIAAYEAGDEDECLKLLLSQRNFLEDHLLAWYPMMAADLQKFPQTDFYKGLGKLTDGFLRNDREFLDAALSENEAEVEVA